MQVAIVVADFNAHVTSRLLEGAQAFLTKNGVDKKNIHTAHVAGCFEIPLVAKKWAESKKVDAVVCLGCVIRGETPHFDYVCDAASRGVQEAMLATGVPMGFGVVMAETADQALDRAGGRHGNRGEEAARAALQSVRALKEIA